MLNGLKRNIAGKGIMVLLNSLANNKNTQTTITGIIAAAIIGVAGLDMPKLLEGDLVQIAHVVSAICLAIIGILATKKEEDGSTSVIGVMAGALQACSGQTQDVITGIVIAVLGYLTNKPTYQTLPPAVNKQQEPHNG